LRRLSFFDASKRIEHGLWRLLLAISALAALRTWKIRKAGYLHIRGGESMKNTDRMFPYRAPDGRSYYGIRMKKYAAIKLRVPRSGDPDLDAMIRESRRADFAEKAMEAITYEYFSNEFNKGMAKADISEIAHCAWLVADAMLVEWEKEAGK
jgi:hypothetical protein